MRSKCRQTTGRGDDVREPRKAEDYHCSHARKLSAKSIMPSDLKIMRTIRHGMKQNQIQQNIIALMVRCKMVRNRMQKTL